MTALLRRLLKLLPLSLIATVLPLPAAAETASANIGIVIMHGKGGSPSKHVADLASSLEGQGFLVVNLEMPWSGRRDYDVNVIAAEGELEAALKSLRDRGAKKLYVAGHSQGGAFALYFGGKHVLDGVIAIAPGGNVGSDTFREKLGEYVEHARKLIAAGKAEEKIRLADFESAKGLYTVTTTPSIYLTWFDPEGAMNQMISVRNMNRAIPVLFIAPSRDYPGLIKVKQKMFDALPQNSRTRLYEPDASHVSAPSASFNEIAEWAAAIANAR